MAHDSWEKLFATNSSFQSLLDRFWRWSNHWVDSDNQSINILARHSSSLHFLSGSMPTNLSWQIFWNLESSLYINWFLFLWHQFNLTSNHHTHLHFDHKSDDLWSVLTSINWNLISGVAVDYWLGVTQEDVHWTRHSSSLHFLSGSMPTNLSWQIFWKAPNVDTFSYINWVLWHQLNLTSNHHTHLHVDHKSDDLWSVLTSMNWNLISGVWQ